MVGKTFKFIGLKSILNGLCIFWVLIRRAFVGQIPQGQWKFLPFAMVFWKKLSPPPIFFIQRIFYPSSSKLSFGNTRHLRKVLCLSRSAHIDYHSTSIPYFLSKNSILWPLYFILPNPTIHEYFCTYKYAEIIIQ